MEAVAALALLGGLALVFHPHSLPRSAPAHAWLIAHGRQIDALAADISQTERSLSSTGSSVASLRVDLSAARQIPPPPGGFPAKAWRAVLDESESALSLLSSPTITAADRSRAADDLTAAGDGLVAVIQTGGDAG